MNEGPSTGPPDESLTQTEKMALFCQQCGHTSPMTGDWLVCENDGDGYHVVCPECETVIVAQPVFSGLA